MDADLWSSRLAAAKRHHALQQSQHYQWDRLSADDFEVDDEVRPEFVCPYCYEDFEISALCSHLEEEHMYESRGVACPVCAARITKDVRRRRYRRSGVPPGSSFSLLGKELREAHLQALLGAYSFPASAECDDLAKQTQCIDDTVPKVVSASSKQHKLNLETGLTAEEREQKLKHATLQAKFAQQLVLSTILGDSH
ncbi:hypothetical protein GOP47_0003081 [Adiantum capillus-veneris]|uniref:Di19 zinc-binding domain-containing protein n=1 Tax=Adiantum capillus-veneris TaxID=13818 RepID=A0A9D4VBS1_ADICA|nr:hypothetical protein GOP47_0003081 [Adiantum capillus-veneris]